MLKSKESNAHFPNQHSQPPYSGPLRTLNTHKLHLVDLYRISNQGSSLGSSIFRTTRSTKEVLKLPDLCSYGSLSWPTHIIVVDNPTMQTTSMQVIKNPNTQPVQLMWNPAIKTHSLQLFIIKCILFVLIIESTIWDKISFEIKKVQVTACTRTN